MPELTTPRIAPIPLTLPIKAFEARLCARFLLDRVNGLDRNYIRSGQVLPEYDLLLTGKSVVYGQTSSKPGFPPRPLNQFGGTLHGLPFYWSGLFLLMTSNNQSNARGIREW